MSELEGRGDLSRGKIRRSVVRIRSCPPVIGSEKPFFSVGLASIGCAGQYTEASEAAICPEFGHRSDYDFWPDLGQRLGQEKHWQRTAEEF
jgi:hypothetical protein